MPIQGPFTWFNKALQRVNADDLNGGHAYKAILVTSSQTFDENFVGGSGNCTYADITAELTTANGYTAGGLALTSPAVSLSSGVVSWGTSGFNWTITGGGVSFRWLLIYDDTDDELLCFADMNTDGAANITALAGTLGFNPTAGAWLRWDQP